MSSRFMVPGLIAIVASFSLLYTLTTTVSVAEAAGNNNDVVINEIMVDPAAVSDADGEWIELKNTTSSSINLTDSVIRVDTDGTLSSTSDQSNTTLSGSIPANGYFVLCRNGNSAQNGGVTCDGTGSFQLNNTSSHIYFYADDDADPSNGSDYFSDVAYNTTSDGGLGTAGQSMTFDSSGVPSTFDGATYGDGDYGTPATENLSVPTSTCDVTNTDTSTGYGSIQGAIDDASDGNTLEVADGSICESFLVDVNNLTIQAETKHGATISVEASGSDRIVDVRSNGVTIDGFVIESQSVGSGVGISISGDGSGPATAMIKNNDISQTLTGIQTTTANTNGGNNINSNVIDSDYGISLQNTSNIIRENDVTAETEGIGASVVTNTINNNNFITDGDDARAYANTSVVAEENWWGSQSGPDTVKGDVDVDPWLCGPFETEPQTSVEGSCDTNEDGSGGDGSSESGLGSIQVTKYSCEAGTEVPTSLDSTIPESCVLEEGAQFGYVHQADKVDGDSSGPWPSSPIEDTITTDSNGQAIFSDLDPEGRYNLVELDGNSEPQDNEMIMSFICEDDAGDVNDNVEYNYLTAGEADNCIAFNQQPETFTVTGEKLVVTEDDESEPQSGGAGWKIYASSSDEIRETETDADGEYEFELPAGEWEIYEEEREDWTLIDVFYGPTEFILESESTGDLEVTSCTFNLGSEGYGPGDQAYYLEDIPSEIPFGRVCNFVNQENPSVEEDRSGGVTTGTRVRPPSSQTEPESESEPEPQVAGVATAQHCPLMTEDLRQGDGNSTFEVMKLQAFLNMFVADNPINGVFGTTTDANVRAFQAQYQEEILQPWVDLGLMDTLEPTGYVYQTTMWKINSMVCPEDTPAEPEIDLNS